MSLSRRIHLSLASLLIPLFFMIAPTSLFAEPHFIVRHYQGKFATNSTFLQILKLIKAEIITAISKVQAELGIKIPENFRCMIEFRDRITIKGALSENHNGRVRALRKSIKDENGYIHELHISLETIFQGFSELREEIQHELTHAMMLESLGGYAYMRVPKWFREGVALLVANQGEERFRQILYSADLTRSPFNGLEGSINQPHLIQDYAEDYQAILWMKKTRGSAILKKMTAALKGGLPFYQLFPRFFNMSFSQFNRRFQRYFRDLIPHYQSTSYLEKRVKEIYSSFKKGEHTQVIRHGETLKNILLPSAQRQMMGYMLSKSYFFRGEYRKTLSHLESLSGYSGPLKKEMSILTARALYELGIFNEARTIINRFLQVTEPRMPYHQEAVKLAARIREKMTHTLPF